MKSYQSVCIVVPCHNEEGAIRGVIHDLLAHVPGATVLVVDDYSTDRTSDKARAAAAEITAGHVAVLRLPVNLGVGGAVQTGFRYAVNHGFDYALKVDGDGQHPALEIPKLLEPLEAGEADFVIGSRFLAAEPAGFQSTASRKVGIKIFEIVNSLLIHQRVTDNTSGFRAYNRRALEFAAAHYPAFDYPEPEEVVLMGRNAFLLKEVPIRMEARQTGVSSISFKRGIYFMFKVLFAVVMTAIRPRLLPAKQ